MTTTTVTTDIAPGKNVPATAIPVPKAKTGSITGFLRRAASILHRWGIGTLFCFLNPFTALLALGWTYRFSQRAALKFWFKRSVHYANGMRFRDYVATNDGLQRFESWPNWVMAEESLRQDGRWRIGRLFAGVRRNFAMGFKGFLTTLAILFVPCFTMMFAWWAGWENSFSKGYEQFSVGSVTSLLAILLFILLMFYVPLAQARLAVTGEARRFFDVRRVLGLSKARWYSYLVLVGGYALLGIPLMIAGAFLGAATSGDSGLADLTPPKALQFLNAYYLLWGIYLFAAYVFLHWFGARVYASSLLAAYSKGQLSPPDLAPFEKQAFEAFQFEKQQPKERNAFVKTVCFAAMLKAVVATALVSALLWFSLVAQIYVTQFFNARPMVKIGEADSGGYWRWMNFPLIQLPYFKHIPEHLSKAAADFEE